MTNEKIKLFNEVHKCLLHLEKIGWAECIDSRYENNVIKDLREQFPNISEEVLTKTLELVLV